MVGTIKRITNNFKLSIPFFDAPVWGQSFEKNMDIIDAVLATAGVVSGIVGEWANNTAYGVDDRVVDSTDNTVWQANVAHTSGSGTFAQDRAANPTYWSIVNTSIVVREEFQTGADYFIGDFVFETDEQLAGVVLSPFTGGASLRDNILNLGVIADFGTVLDGVEADITALQSDVATLQSGKANLVGGNSFSGGNQTIDGHIFITGNIQEVSDTGNIAIFGGNGTGANIELYGGSHATLANDLYIDADELVVRAAAGGAFRAVVNGTSFDVNDIPFTLRSNSAGAAGPELTLTHASASPAVSDIVASFRGVGKNVSAADIVYARIAMTIQDATAGSEDGRMHLQTMIGGVFSDTLTVDGTRIRALVPFIGPANTLGDPAFGFEGDENTGMRRVGENTVGLIAGGTLSGYFNTTGLTVGPTSAAFGTDDAAKVLLAGQLEATNTGGAACRISRIGDGQVISYHHSAANVGGHTVTAAGTTFNATSDGRLKINRVPIHEDLDLDLIYDALDALGYDMLAVATQEFVYHGYGYIAQDVYEIPGLSQFVTPGSGEPGDPDFVPWMLDYTGLHTVILATIKHRQRKLEARIAALEAA